MKALKRIFIGLLVIIIVAVAASFFLPSEVHVERSTEIGAPAKVVFAQINDLKKWEQWGPWYEKDPNIKGEYSGPEAGVGATYSWESDHKEVGEGSVTITESVEGQSIKTSLDFMKEGKATGDFIFEAVEENVTKVTWSMDADMGMNPIGKFMGLMMDKMVGPDFEKGLANLKSYTESIPVEPENPFNIAIKEYNSQPMYAIRDSTNTDSIGGKMEEVYGELLAFLKESGDSIAGPPIAIWFEWNEEEKKCVFEAAIPVTSLGKVSGRVFIDSIPTCTVVTATHFGAYSESANIHEAIDEYLIANNHTPIGSPWEVYVTDPSTEPDTSKWQTEIYYPIK